MSVKDALLLVVGLGILIAVPAAMIWGVVDHVRNSRKRERRSTGSGGLGAALQELDRLVARPSVEHTVEAEKQSALREDEKGGD
jgi:hypothetical protein